MQTVLTYYIKDRRLRRALPKPNGCPILRRMELH